eukprot:m.1110481 g.1110481  ORF g.1110481 m.1110481 type:complete len:812 (+) comp24357_c0_seq1:205-2640(+)
MGLHEHLIKRFDILSDATKDDETGPLDDPDGLDELYDTSISPSLLVTVGSRVYTFDPNNGALRVLQLRRDKKDHEILEDLICRPMYTTKKPNETLSSIAEALGNRLDDLISLNAEQLQSIAGTTSPSTALPQGTDVICENPFDPAPDADGFTDRIVVRQLIVSENGAHVALVGPTHVSVVHLPEDRGARYAPTHQVPCRMKSIGDVYNAQVKQVSWHPLCCQCLAVLNGDGKLRFYDVLAGAGSGGVSHPTFSLAVGSDETNPMRGLDTDHGAVAFDFGPAVGWDAFTIFVLLENSDLTYFCPVVPPGSVVCTSILDDLTAAAAPGGVEAAWLAELNRTKIQDTLTDASAELVLVEQPGAHADGDTANTWTPKAQGPLSVLPENVDCNHSDAGYDLLVLPMLPTTVVTADVGGFITVGVVLDTVQPRWCGQSNQSDVPCARWNVVEKITLGLSKSQSNLRLVKDHIYPERFFTYHSEGAHVIHAVYLETFRRLFNGAVDVSLPAVCQSNVCCLVSAVPIDPAVSQSNAVIGFLILHDPRVGYHWVARMQDGTHLVMPLDRPAEAALRLRYHDDADARDPVPAACAALEADARRFHGEVSQCLAGAQMPITCTGGSDRAVDSLVKCSQLVEATVQAMTETHMVQLRKAQLMLEQRGRDQMHREQEQHRTLESLQHEIEAIKNKNDLLRRQKQHTTMQVEDLVARLEDTIFCYNNVTNVTSTAEQKFRGDIQKLSQETRQIERQTQQTMLKCRRAARAGMLRGQKPAPGHTRSDPQLQAQMAALRDDVEQDLAGKIDSLQEQAATLLRDTSGN